MGRGEVGARRAAGFTLVEVMVAIAVVAVATAVALPDFDQWVTNSHIRSAAAYCQESLQWARGYALKTDEAVAVSVTSAGGECGWTMDFYNPQTQATTPIQGAPLMTTYEFRKRFAGIACAIGPNSLMPIIMMPNGMVMTSSGAGSTATLTPADNLLVFTAKSDPQGFSTWLVRYYGAGELRSCASASPGNLSCAGP